MKLASKAAEVRVEVEDDGKPFNPLEAPDVDITKSLEDRGIGGLGIHIVHKLVDGLEYHRHDDKNLLIVRKHLR